MISDSFEEIKNKVLSEIKVSPYMDTVLLGLVEQGYWHEISIDYYPQMNIVKLYDKPFAIVHHGRILTKDLFAHDINLNTIEYVKPYIVYLKEM